MSELIKLNDGGTAIINNSLFPQKNDYFFRNSRVISNKHIANTSRVDVFCTLTKTLVLPISSQKNNKLLSNIRRVNLFSSVIYDDGIGFSDKLIYEVEKILVNLQSKQPRVFTNGYGEIQLEYENGIKYLEIAVCPDLSMNIFRIDENGNEYEKKYQDIDQNVINQEVSWFYDE